MNINYTSTSSNDIYTGFAASGDFAYPQFKGNLETILNNDVRVALIYGDADYICATSINTLSLFTWTSFADEIKRRQATGSADKQSHSR